VILPFLFGWLQRATGSYALCFVVAAGVCTAVALLLVSTGRRASPQV
jgi:cyanate permease